MLIKTQKYLWALLAVVCLHAIMSCVPDEDDPLTVIVSVSNQGIWTDPISGLSWQNPSPYSLFLYHEAVSYCSNLSLEEQFDWRLPDINELRSLVRGCPPIELGGSCPVADPDCLESTCQSDYLDVCFPDCEDEVLWDPELEGLPATYHSDSVLDDDEYRTWMVQFGPAGGPSGENNIGVWSTDMMVGAMTRCVHDPL
jgi:hypothetical protein